jgi:hypothetical protein
MPVLVGGLLRVAWATLVRIHELAGRKRRARRLHGLPDAENRPERALPPAVLTEMCSLALAITDRGRDSNEKSPCLTWLAARLEDWMPFTADRGAPASRTWFRQRLMALLDLHSYPLHNRLCGLKALIDDALLNDREPGVPAGEVEAHIEELIQLELLYNSPLHFTPLQSGLTLAMAYLAWERLGIEGLERNRVYSQARQKLIASQQLYTMQRSYYEMISGLYYLYDDFNDRTIHYHQAIQMAGTELTSYMISLLDEAEGRAPMRGGPSGPM